MGNSVHAEERPREPTLAERGGFVVTFERLLGYSIDDFNRYYNPDRAGRHFGVGAVLGPRIGFHGVVGGGLTVGGFVGSLAVIEERGLRTAATVAGPRVGWLFTSSVVGVWPRLGFTWLVLPRGDEDFIVSYAVEVPLTVQVTKHAGVLVGPSLELPASRDRSPAYTSLAFTAGLFGAF